MDDCMDDTQLVMAQGCNRLQWVTLGGEKLKSIDNVTLGLIGPYGKKKVRWNAQI